MRAMAALRALRPTPVLRPRLLAATMFLLTFRFSITPPPPELLADRPLPPSGGGGPDVVITDQWSSLVETLALHTATVHIVLLGARWLARRIGPRVAPARTAGAGLERGELIRDWALTFAALIGLGLVSLAVLRVSFELPGNSTLPPVTPLVAVGFTAPLLLITVVLSVLPAAESALGTIREELAREGVDVRGVKTDPERLTALVLLGIRDDRQFPLIFYRENCADMAHGKLKPNGNEYAHSQHKKRAVAL
jgi:hypothetical protein